MNRIRMSLPVIGQEIEVEFGCYGQAFEDGPNMFDLYGITPELNLTEEQEAAILEFLHENYEPTVDADRV